MNPFLPYDDDLWVTHVSETHTVLLNKFNLVERHVLVVTREFRHQSEPLTVEDVSATWTTLNVRCWIWESENFVLRAVHARGRHCVL